MLARRGRYPGLSLDQSIRYHQSGPVQLRLVRRYCMPITFIIAGAASLGCSNPDAPATTTVEPAVEPGTPSPAEVFADCLEDSSAIAGAAKALRDHESTLLGEFKDLTTVLAEHTGRDFDSIVVDYIEMRTRVGNDLSITLTGMGQKFSELSREEFAALKTPSWTTRTTSESQLSRYASMGVATYTFHGCVSARLGLPDRVREQMSATRAIDGMQSEEFDDYRAQWTYHPDDGLRVTYSVLG